MSQALTGKGTPWNVFPIRSAVSAGGATLTRQPDGSYLAGGKNPANDTYTVTAALPAGTLTGLMLEALPDPSLPGGSLGRFTNGNFVLSDVALTLVTADGKRLPVAIVDAQADFEQEGYPVKSLVDAGPAPAKGKKAAAKTTKAGPGWAIAGNVEANRVPRKALLVLGATPVPAGASLTVELHHKAIGGHNVGRFRLSTSDRPAAALDLKESPATSALRALLAKAPAARTAADRKELAKLFLESPEHPRQAAQARLTAAMKAKEAAGMAGLEVMVMKERATPKDAFVLTRGEYDKPGAKVERKLPAFLPPLPAGEPNNRLGFARWLVNGQHPLTGRVWVNRAWERLFGTGLVKTSENFGSQAEWPSHPELLDWLAVDFVERKWDMKGMLKFIMMSQAYRQSARVTADQLEKDPENRLISRGPRFRLSAETIRDQALAASGLLIAKVGGPSVKPYMPEAVWDETSVYGDMRNYKADTGEGLYRRSLYTIWKRTAAPPSMLLFDSATREVCTVKRSRSNTPLQALSLLNEVTYIEAARKLAELSLRQPGNLDQRLAWAFRRVTARELHADEAKVLRTGLEQRLAKFRADLPAAQKLLANGRSPAPTDLDAAELAAWSVTANILLNLDETITRE
jgi:hypothetical protein